MDFVSHTCSIEANAIELGYLTDTYSSYTVPPATLHIGPNKLAYFVPKNFLPAEWIDCSSQEPLHFPDVDILTGHTIVHYLYKGNYESSATNDGTPSHYACTKLKAALLVYIATCDHVVPGLQPLATREIEEHGSRLDLVDILDAIDGDFSKLCQDSWVHGYLRQKAKMAFEQNHTVFTSEALLRNLNNTALLKFLMQCTSDFYNIRFSQMLSMEREQCQGVDNQDQRARDASLDRNNPTLKQNGDFIVPSADDMPMEESSVPDIEDVMTHEDFCTISCPSSGSDCGAEAYSHDNTVRVISETTTSAVQDACYEACKVPLETPAEPEPPEVPEYVPEFLQAVASAPTWVAPEEEIAQVPSDCDAVQDDASVEPKPTEAESLQQRCQFQANHILHGNGWEHCRRCRETVDELATQASQVSTEARTERKDFVSGFVEAGRGRGRGRRRMGTNVN
jgi:hypothetical protein